jgi:hypothetical protein
MPYAQNKPGFVYINRTYTCANNIPNVPNSLDINVADNYVILGKWVSLAVNVTSADTNPTDSAGRFFFMRPGWMFNTGTGVESFLNNWDIDLRSTGVRTVTPTTVTGLTGADAGISAPGTNTWVGGNSSTNVVNPSNVTNGPAAQCPVVNVEFKTTR